MKLPDGQSLADPRALDPDLRAAGAVGRGLAAAVATVAGRAGVSQRGASMPVSTPIEQPGSNALA